MIFLAAFDTGPKEKYWPGEFEIVEDRSAPPESYWREARAIPRKDGKGKLISLQIAPPRPVGEEMTCSSSSTWAMAKMGDLFVDEVVLFDAGKPAALEKR